MAKVVKRAGTKLPWQVRFYDHAGRRRSEQFRLKDDAKARAEEIERARRGRRLDLLDAGLSTLDQLGAEFFRTRKQDLAPATARLHAYVWNAHVHSHELASMPVGSIRPSTVASFKADLRAAGVGDHSVRKALGLVSQVLDRAALDGILSFNPCAPVKRPGGGPKGDVKVVSPASVEALRERMDPRDAAIVSVLAYAGLRPEELRALEWRHVGDRTLRVEFACNPDGTLRALKGRAGHARGVPLCDALAGDLLSLRGEGLVFSRYDGSHWTKRIGITGGPGGSPARRRPLVSPLPALTIYATRLLRCGCAPEMTPRRSRAGLAIP